MNLKQDHIREIRLGVPASWGHGKADALTPVCTIYYLSLVPCGQKLSAGYHMQIYMISYNEYSEKDCLKQEFLLYW